MRVRAPSAEGRRANLAMDGIAADGVAPVGVDGRLRGRALGGCIFTTIVGGTDPLCSCCRPFAHSKRDENDVEIGQEI